MIHILKTWPEPFRAVASGLKTFEVRKTDRYFNVGDTLRLAEWDPDTGRFSGREALRRVTFILPGGGFGLPADLCVMAIVPAEDP